MPLHRKRLLWSPPVSLAIPSPALMARLTYFSLWFFGDKHRVLRVIVPDTAHGKRLLCPPRFACNTPPRFEASHIRNGNIEYVYFFTSFPFGRMHAVGLETRGCLQVNKDGDKTLLCTKGKTISHTASNPSGK